MYNSKLSITCFFILVVIQNCYADAISESDLRRAIFENYDKLVRPVRSASTAVPLTAALYPMAVEDVDVKDHIVKLDTLFFLKWHDDYLTWDPSSYGGLDALRVPSEEVWKPDLTVYTGAPDTIQPTVHTNVVLYANGTVLWVPPFSFKTRCPVTEDQVTEDHFKCTIHVGSWTYDVTLLDVHEKEEDVFALAMKDDFYHDTNKDWKLESMTARTELKHFNCCAEAYPVIIHELVFKKKEDDHHD